jgi:hypothetical protein
MGTKIRFTLAAAAAALLTAALAPAVHGLLPEDTGGPGVTAPLSHPASTQ